MLNPRMRPAFAALSLAAALAVPSPTAAQTRQATPEAPLQGVSTFDQNAQETRRQLYKILDNYPPAVGRILRLDPTLMTNAGYLASYPTLAAFLSQNPGVARNAGFYLERYDPNYSFPQPRDPKHQAIEMWEDVLGFMGAFLVFSLVAVGLFTLIKYVIEYRRWHRISKVNAEVHNKILDRFASNEELLAYIDSPAGRRFLEATPIAPNAVPGRVAAPYGRILLSVQIGILLIGLSLGIWWVSLRVIEEVREVFTGLAIVGFMLGLGCVVSAGASYALSRKLGLLQDSPAPPPVQPV